MINAWFHAFHKAEIDKELLKLLRKEEGGEKLTAQEELFVGWADPDGAIRANFAARG